MTNKRKGSAKPQRLMDMFTVPREGGRQDGADAASTPRPPHQTKSLGGERSPRTAQTSPPNTHLSTPSPSDSPVKTRMRLDGAGCGPAVSPVTDSGDDTRELPDSIATFPTSNQPVMDTVLRDMLVTLRSSLQADMMNCMHRVSGELREVEGRVEHIESKMGEYASTINNLVDASEVQEESSEWIKNKLADLEDRFRRNNMKIRGIPESVQPLDLRSYAIDLFSSLLPDLTNVDLTIDRIHRLPKPAFLPAAIPRDVILHMTFFHVKEQLMQAMRRNEKIPSRFQNLQLYPDLSQHTLQKRRNLGTITKALRNHDISYKWGFPTKLIITYREKSFNVDSVDRGIALLKTWEILPVPREEDKPTSHNNAVTPVWKQVTHRNARSHK